MILYNSENSIHDIRPFCRLLCCYISVVKPWFWKCAWRRPGASVQFFKSVAQK